MSDYPALEDMQFKATALVATDRPGRYAKQLASHLGHKISVTDLENGYRLLFNRDGQFGGYALLVPGEGVLEMSAFAPSAEGVDRLADVLGRHLVRFGERDELVVEFSAA